MVKRPPKSQRQYAPNATARIIASKLLDRKKSRKPDFIEPSLATLRDRIPAGESWLHEIKFDGYRLQLHKNNMDVRLFTRRGYDWSKRFSSLREAAWYLNCDSCILDGEVIVPTESGLSDFGALEADLGKGRSDRFIFYVFDILYFDGFDLRASPLVDRKRVLEALWETSKGAESTIALSATIEGGGPSLFKHACELHLEGIVSKRKDARYRSGRSNNWTKVTCRKRDTFVVAGIAHKGGKFDGIYLARREKGGLQYAGKVENGFSTTSSKDLEKRSAKLVSKTQPLKKKIRKPKATWLKPGLLVDVEYRALTGEGKLRHPSFKGIREDYPIER
jgi:bifunctional non-homologous end joining protein LigD